MLTTHENILWYKSAVIYELHIRAFHDSNGDGTGDFRGLIKKLDYLVDLGVTAIWILPFYPSPLKDDGYDIADYENVHPHFGTLADFQLFIKEAHARGLRVITELVINHTSDQHDWFQRSRRAAPGSYWRDYYVWSDTPSKYKEVRIIFKDFETSNWTWDPVAKAYYWHRFYSHQPDLNFDNPEVQKAIFKVLDYWMDMGVDGFRLDAVPYLFERDGTSCENLPETHEFLRKLRRHVDVKYPGRMLLAEANQWPEDAVQYFGNGDECHMNFHFPLMPRLFMAIKMEDRYSVLDIIQQTPAIHESCQWATFLRNHDELTLEMVTDEERDYMYKVYATDPRAAINLGIRRRLAPLVNNDRRQIELLNALLFSMPGTPVLYYGDEIGMGDNVYLGDRNGVRTPFQWSPDRNAGFSTADPQSLYLPLISNSEYHYETLNVETSQKNPHSLLWWTKKLIAVRKANPALSSGSLEFVDSENPKVLSFVRIEGNSTILAVANLSRTVQCVQLDLKKFKGRQPLELFGQVEFPSVTDAPYFITLGPYSFYWFELKDTATAVIEEGFARIEIDSPTQNPLAFFNSRTAPSAQRAILKYLPQKRWFLGKGRRLQSCGVIDSIDIQDNDGTSLSQLVILEAQYREGVPEFYVLPLSFVTGENAEKAKTEYPSQIVAECFLNGNSVGLIVESSVEPKFIQKMVRRFASPEIVDDIGHGWLRYDWKSSTKSARETSAVTIPSPALGEQTNSSFFLDKKFYFKLYRKIEAGHHPEVIRAQHFSAGGSFKNTNELLGVISYVHADRVFPIATLQTLIENQGDGWAKFIEQVSQVAEKVAATTPSDHVPVEDIAGPTIAWARLLGARTADMHRALADDRASADFTPEAYTPFYQRSLYQSFRNTLVKSMGELKMSLINLPADLKPLAEEVLKSEDRLNKIFEQIKTMRIDSLRIKVHGDFHLGQVLFKGNDFDIVDFEGEPKKSFSERAIKRSPLRDVAGMLRSFDYLTSYYLKEKILRPEDLPRLTPFLEAWGEIVRQEYLKAYVENVGEGSLVPRDSAVMYRLLQIHELEKALYEISYELASRPAWVDIPLRGVLKILSKVPL